MMKTRDYLTIRASGKSENDLIEWVSEPVRKLLYLNPVGKKLGDVFPQYFSSPGNSGRHSGFITIDSQNFVLIFQEIGMESCVLINLYPAFANDDENNADTYEDELEKKTLALKMAIKDMEQHRQKLRQTNEMTGSGSFEYLVEQKCLVLSPESCAILGIKNCNPVVHLDEICRNTGGKEFKQLCEVIGEAEQNSVLESEICINDENDGERHLRVILKKSAPNNISIDGIFQDISFVKKAERSLKSKDSYYRAIYENSNIGICTLDECGFTLECNRYILNLTGYSFEELNNVNAIDCLVHEDDRTALREAITRMRTTGENVSSAEFRIVRKDGSVAHILGSFQLYKDGDVRIFGFVSDISDIKSFQDKTMEQERMLLQQSKMATIGEMVGIIAHQWVQPLNSIAMISQMLQELLELDDESEKLVRKTVSSINEQINFMLATANDFKNFLKPSEKPTLFSVGEAINSVLDLYRPQLKYYYIKCGVYFDSEEMRHSIVYGYENEFKNVILNLCTNAKDALENSGVADAEIEISVEPDADGKHVIISVSDNGGGIPEELLGKLFTAYVSSKGEKGTGLGLYMSKLIIAERMSGTIKAENTERGAKISITLPNVNS